MQYRVFQYPIPAPPDLQDLNSYLAGHRVAGVMQYLATSGGTAILVFVVETVGASGEEQFLGRAKVDYRAELSPEDFAVFSRLRAWRKEAAEREGVPVYTLFTNAQLAEMAKRRVASAAELRDIDGVGAGRVEKYGGALLAILSAGRDAPDSGGGEGSR